MLIRMLRKLKAAVARHPDNLFDYNHLGPETHGKGDCGCAYHVAIAYGIVPRDTDYGIDLYEKFGLDESDGDELFNNSMIDEDLATGREGKRLFYERLHAITRGEV
jgi:hypothetical protein